MLIVDLSLLPTPNRRFVGLNVLDLALSENIAFVGFYNVSRHQVLYL